MKDVEIIGLIKTYIKQTLVGMGALKGAACQITSIVDSGTSHVITFSWQDNAGVTHTNTLTLVDGADEVDELKDISITNLQDGQVLAWDNTAKKWVNTANSSTVASINNIGDVTVTNVTNGQILEWDNTASKWVNASLGTAAKKDSTNAVTENSTDVVESGAVFTAIDDAVKDLDVSDTAVAGSYVTEVSETDGKISVAREAADATPTENSNKLVKSGGVYAAINDAVKALDVSDTAVAGSYVTEVSETDGKISVTREAADAAPTENSNKLVKSGGVYSAIDDAVKALDVSDTAVAGSYVTEVSETDGKISVVREAADAAPTESSNKLVKSGGVYSAIDDAVKALDVSDTAVAGSYVTEVSETDGKISVAREAADAAPTENSNKLVKSGGVYTAIDNAVKALDVTDTAVAGSYVTSVSETDGKIAVTRAEADSVPTQNSPKAVKSNGVYVANNTIYSVMGINGAKNLVDIPDFTLIKDTNRTKSVSISALPKRPYICSFDVTDASDPINGQVQVFDINNYAVGGVTITENGHYSFPVSADHDNYRNIYAYISSTLADGTTMKISNFMIRLASDTDSTYQPYAKTNQELTKDLIGLIDNVNKLGAKNLLISSLKTNTYGGLTFTVNVDGSVTLSGTAETPCGRDGWGNFGTFSYPAGEYILSDGGAGSQATNRRMYYRINGSSVNPVVNSSKISLQDTDVLEVWIYVDTGVSGNGVTFYPMLRLASDTDDTYEPYAKGNQEITKDTAGLIDNENILGAKNFLKQVFDNVSIPNVGDIGDRASSANGLSFTYNDDGSITVNGTPTDSTLRVEIKLDWKTNSYKNNDISAIAGKDVIGSIVPTAVDGIQMRLGYFEAGGTGHQSDAITTSLKYTLPQNAKYLRTYISISGAYSYNNVTLYPMVRLASDTDDTYAPYAKTNRELTENIAAAITDVYEVTTPAFSSLPQTFNAPGITSDHKLIVDGSAVLSTPSAQANDWTITTGTDTITISGTFAGSTATTVKMTLGIKRAITATV